MVLPVVRSVKPSAGKLITIDHTLNADGLAHAAVPAESTSDDGYRLRRL
jgi:hypothetical protein